MKRSLLAAVLMAVTLMFSACSSSTSDSPTAPVTQTDVIVGAWISEGVDIAPGLASTLKTTNIVATFNSNNTYTVVATDSLGAAVTYSGTYTTAANSGSTIRSIILNQTVPTSVTSTGIYEVGTNGYLTYEVIQTTPAINGFAAPTASGGFGSTSYNGTALGATWTQRFVPSAPTTEPMVGTWLSDGANVAPGLAATLKTKSITATFNSNNTYTVVATDSSNASVTYSGTFTTAKNNNTSIRNITLNQTVPASVTSTGIYRVTAKGVLSYEVIQTTPAINGFTAPTAAGGFGSTAYNGVPLGKTWIQLFIKQ
jgi:hypothetical protein